MYRARLDHVQPVAVKMLKPDFFKDKDQDERDKIIQSFVNEVLVLEDARLLGNLWQAFALINQLRFQHCAGCVHGGPEFCLSMNICPELGVPNRPTTLKSLFLPYVVSPTLGRPAPTGFARESAVHQPCWQPRFCLSCHMA